SRRCCANTPSHRWADWSASRWSTSWKSTWHFPVRVAEQGDPGDREAGAGGRGDSRLPPPLCARSLGGGLERYLEAEVLLGGAVERLPVADPERVESRVGGELRRRSLARQQSPRVGRLHPERRLERIPASRQHGRDRALAVVDREVVA